MLGQGIEGEITKVPWETFEVINIFIMLILMVVSWTFIYFKMYQMNALNMCGLFKYVWFVTFINYSSIMLLKMLIVKAVCYHLPAFREYLSKQKISAVNKMHKQYCLVSRSHTLWWILFHHWKCICNNEKFCQFSFNPQCRWDLLILNNNLARCSVPPALFE